MLAAVRADALPTIGAGHVSRCVTLARELAARAWDVRFFSSVVAQRYVSELAGPSFAVTAHDVPREAELLIVDHYDLDREWEGGRAAKTVLVIDDLANRRHACHLLLDQNLWPEPDARYRSLVPVGCKLLLGPTYALIRAEIYRHRIALRPIPDAPRHAVISFGGSDPNNHSTRIAVLLRECAPTLAIDLLVGGANPNAKEVVERFSNDSNLHVHVGLSDIGPLLARADVAIGAGGVSLWERACLGVPSLSFAIAEISWA